MITSWYWSGSLDAWADICILRCAKRHRFESQIVECDLRRDAKAVPCIMGSTDGENKNDVDITISVDREWHPQRGNYK